MSLTRKIEMAVFSVISIATIIFAAVISMSGSIDDTQKADDVYADIEESLPEVEPVNVNIFVGKEMLQASVLPDETVGSVLDGLDAEIPDGAILNVDRAEKVTDGMIVTVGGHEISSYVENKITDFGITFIETQTIPKGTVQLKEEGSLGSITETHRTVTLDCEIIFDEVILTEVIKEPADTVYYKGVGGTVTAKDGTSYEFNYCMEVTATAYAAKGITATGKPATDGIIAVDPKVIPYGTKVFVTGNYAEFGVCSAEDTGGFIKGNRIDICMSGSREDLLRFGRRKMTIYILE